MGGIPTNIQRAALGTKLISNGTGTTYSNNVTNCPGKTARYNILWELALTTAHLGYTLGLLQESDIGLTAQLTLAGPTCNAFGLDISDLTIEVTYQSLSTYIACRILCEQR